MNKNELLNDGFLHEMFVCKVYPQIGVHVVFVNVL